MFFSPDMLMAMQGSPPPQGVLDKRPLWFVLMMLLGLTLFLRMAAFDILGGLLCGLLLILVVVITRDGMKELPKFGLIFGLLCGINFFFYVLPVLSSVMSGRSERRIEPVDSVSYGDNSQRLTYTMTVRTKPFFDPRGSLLYNVQSAGMLAMPFCMLLGTYLGVSAHQEIARHSGSFFRDDESDDLDLARPGRYGAVAGGDASVANGRGDVAAADGGGIIRGTAATAAAAAVATVRAARHGAVFGAAVDRLSPGSRGPPVPQQKAFQGTAHKLGK